MKLLLLLLILCSVSEVSGDFRFPILTAPMATIPALAYREFVSLFPEYYYKVSIYEVWQSSGSGDNVPELDVFANYTIFVIYLDTLVFLTRGTLTIAKLEERKLYDCPDQCYFVKDADIIDATALNQPDLNNVQWRTVLQIHKFSVKALEKKFCFNMTSIELPLNLSSLRVINDEWPLFVPHIVAAAIKCRADQLNVTVSELAELLNTNTSTLYGYNMNEVENIFFPAFDDLLARKILFQNKNFSLVIAGNTTAQWQSQTMAYYANQISQLSVRHLEILYKWKTAQLFAIGNIRLFSYFSECSSLSTAVSAFNLSKTIFGYQNSLPSCNVAFVLSRSISEDEIRFGLTSILDRNILNIMRNASGISSWFDFYQILFVISEGIWMETPVIPQVQTGQNLTDDQVSSYSVPQIASAIRALNASGGLSSIMSNNYQQYLSVLLQTYSMTNSSLAALTGRTEAQIDGLTIQEAHNLVFEALYVRYDIVEFLNKLNITGVYNYVAINLPSFEWYRLVRAAIESSFDQLANAFSTNLTAATGGVTVVTLADGTFSVQIQSGSISSSFVISASRLASCLDSTTSVVYQRNILSYQSFYQGPIVHLMRKKITMETKNLDDFLAQFGITFESIADNETVGQTIDNRVGLTEAQLQCMYGWSSQFTSFLHNITWSKVCSFRLCGDFFFWPLHKIVVGLRYSTPMVCDATVSFSSTSYVASEGSGVVDINITLSGLLLRSAEIGYLTLPGSASNADFVSDVANITFNPGEPKDRQITLHIIQDDFVEASEQFRVILQRRERKTTIGEIGEVTVTIVDDDKAVVQHVEAIYTLKEDVGYAFLGVRLVNITGPLETNVNVSVVTVGTTATKDVDFTAPSPVLTFLKGDFNLTRSIVLAVVNDTAFETNENLSVVLSPGSDEKTEVASPASAIVTITNDDVVQISFTSNSFSVTEGQAAAISLEVTAGTLGTPVTVSVTAKGVTARNGDFNNTKVSVTFLAGEGGPKIVTIETFDDNFVESREVFTVSLNTSTAGILLGNSSSVSIIDNDVATVQFSSEIFSVNENLGYVDILVQLTGVLEGLILVSVSTKDDTALAGSDYGGLSDYPLEFSPGEATSQYIRINITDDPFIEGPERFTVSVLSGSLLTRIGNINWTTIQIIDNDAVSAHFLTNTRNVNEDAGAVNMTISLTTTAPLERDVSIRFSTEEDTAKSPEDFSDVGFNVTFNEGDTNGATRQATFTIIDDEIVEADKTFNVKLTSIDPGFTPATFSSMAIRIIDNDRATLAFAQTAYSVNEAETSVVLLVLLTGTIARDVMARISTASQDATAGNDYTSIVNQPITFSPGNSSVQTISVNISNDEILEYNERFTATLSAENGVAINASAQTATVTIIDNDEVTVTLFDTTISVTEASGNAIALVEATGTRERDIYVNVSTYDVSASTAANDYEAKSEMVTIEPASSGPKPFPVAILEDNIVENTEQFGIRVTSTDAQVKIVNGEELISIEDNDIAVIRLVKSEYHVNESVVSLTVEMLLQGENSIAIPATITLSQETAARADYFLANGSVTFNPGEKAKEISIFIVDDLIVEQRESFKATLTAGNSKASVDTPGEARIFIEDNDDLSISFERANFIVSESVGTITVHVIVNGSTSLHSLDFGVTATDGTAQTPGDYILLTSSVHLTPGATRHEISVRIMDDVSVENNETFSLNLNNGRNTRIRVSGNEEMTILIVDDDETNKCLKNPCSQNATCQDTFVSFSCTCNAGYSGDGFNLCADIDECKDESLCVNGFTCVNTLGSYECVCKGRVKDGECSKDFIRYRVNLRLNENYTDALSKKDSEQFKQVSSGITNAVKGTYEGNKDFFDVEVLKLSPGSIIADLDLIFKETEASKASGLKELLASIRNNSFGDFDVDKDALTVVIEGTCPSDECSGNSTCKVLTANTISCPCNEGFYYDGVMCKENIVIKVEITIAGEFVPELKNESSPVFKELKKNVTDELTEQFKDAPNFVRVDVLGFSNGSVKVDFIIIYRDDPDKSEKVIVAEKLKESIEKGELGGLNLKGAKIKLPPPPPTDLKHTEVTKNTIHISWGKPKGEEYFDITGYIISHKMLSQSEYKMQNISSETTLNLVIGNLASGTFYEILVHGYNEIGDGDKIKAEVKTDESDSDLVLIIVVVIAVVFVIIVVLCIVFLRLKKRRDRREQTPMSEYSRRTKPRPVKINLQKLSTRLGQFDNAHVRDEEI